MELTRFSLGLRVACTAIVPQSLEAIWALLFSRIPAELLKKMTLFGARDDVSKDEPEPAYLCVFSNASLSRAKRLYAYLQNDTVLCSYLTAFQPFVQNNFVEKCTRLTYLGRIAEDGVVSGGDMFCAGMRFTGVLAEKTTPMNRLHIILAPQALSEAVSSMDVGRTLMRQAAKAFPDARISMVRIADDGQGTLDMLVAACRGRYVGLEKTGGCCGVLPDRTAVIETVGMDQDDLLEKLSEIRHLGYHKIVIASGDSVQLEVCPKDLELTILSNLPKDQLLACENITYCSGIETILEKSGFFRMCTDAAIVIVSTIALDEACKILGSTVDTVLFHCRGKNIPTAVLAYQKPDCYSIKNCEQPAYRLEADTLEEAAATLMEQIGKICKRV
ncbi:MAG: glycerate kinase [Clostridia bacterium]